MLIMKNGGRNYYEGDKKIKKKNKGSVKEKKPNIPDYIRNNLKYFSNYLSSES